MEIICRTCRTPQPTENYYKKYTRADGSIVWRWQCKSCAAEATLAWSKANPGRRADIAKRSYARNHHKHVNKLRAKRFGITLEHLEQMLAAQGDKCAICQEPHSHLDHDHATGEVRGLLCRGCNLGLGNFNDDADRLRSAIKYLEAQ